MFGLLYLGRREINFHDAFLCVPHAWPALNVFEAEISRSMILPELLHYYPAGASAEAGAKKFQDFIDTRSTEAPA